MGLSTVVEDWFAELIADPITKLPLNYLKLPQQHGVPDARVYLRNTAGFHDWESGQIEFENWERDSIAYDNQVANYQAEIAWDRDMYRDVNLGEPVLDVGGHLGTIREFLPSSTKYISADPYINAVLEVPEAKVAAYECLNQPLNFIAALAEFLPIKSEVIGTVHMRSMLDHVQVPDLALIEAHRVLKPNGKLIVGMSIEGAPYGLSYTKFQKLKIELAQILGNLGVKRFKVHHDHHTWHPTINNLRELIQTNGFEIEEEIWQEKWQGRVVYIFARKS